MNESVLAVILNWNGIKYVRKCVEHVRAQIGVGVRILVVDNASTDSSVAQLRAMEPPCDVLELSTNQGFAEGMNAGLRKAISGGFAYVWLVNSDAFPAPGCLEALVADMESDPTLMMVTPRLLCEDGSEQHAGGIVDWQDGNVLFLYADALSRPSSDAHWLTGTAPLIRTTALEKSGLLEAAFFAYWEDVDLSVRITRAGGTLKAVPGATAVHLGGASLGSASPIAVFLGTRNKWLFLERNAPASSARARWLRFVAASIQYAALARLRGRPDLAACMLAGISAARRRRFGAVPVAIEPAALERWLFLLPWRSSSMLQWLANRIEPRRN